MMALAARTDEFDLAAGLKALAEQGHLIVPDALSTAELKRVREATYAVAETDEAGGVPVRGFPFDPDRRNVRLFRLLNKGTVFCDLAEHPLALAFLKETLGEDALLSNLSGNITAPGSGAMGLHADQGYMDEPWPERMQALNVIWVLDDFTEENGATRFVPGSHKLARRPKADERCDSTALIATAGSAIVMDGRLWHQTGANKTGSERRAALFAYYVRPYLRPQENYQATLDPAVLERASPVLRRLLGFEANATGDLRLIGKPSPGNAPAGP